ncbi:MAG: hypothetical protein JSV99_04115 [Planctomycetota bacterium]|nr:MAG: hypothetical protein JSV99_04115 [Planctomycetota bacterium]
MKHPIITSALVLILLVALPTRAAATLLNSNSIIEDNIEYYMQTDKFVYHHGEIVDMFYSATNLGPDDVTIGWVAADPLAHYTFKVMQGNAQIWRYNYITPVLAFEPFTLGPYQSRAFQTAWNLMHNNGTPWNPDDDFPVSPGTYSAIGELNLVPFLKCDRVPVSVCLQVIPEPATIFLLALPALVLLRTRRPQRIPAEHQ